MILDSGKEKRTFDTGAVRDINEEKGRCDLLPLTVVEMVMEQADGVLTAIEQFKVGGNTSWLVLALRHFIKNYWEDSVETAMLEVSVHFFEGSVKYGEYNWQKGIPLHSYIDSAVRHYLKFLRGDDDERHDRAFMWNIMCAIWTCNNKPELDDIVREE